jgi:3-methyl-2-oxobutanoate hydroxymethyltransferase
MKRAITTTILARMKVEEEKIAAVTAYDYPFARLADESGIHQILVGDSLGMVVQGKENTLSVTMEEMLYHTLIVSRAVQHAMVIGDMPFMSYQTNSEQAVRNAGRFVKEAGAAAVKLEGGVAVCDAIYAISNAGIPLQAHIGLTPQSVHQMGGYRVQRNESRLVSDAVEVEKAGAFSIVLEGIPADISKKITAKVSIPTIGIGAGPHCDGQILVMHDLVGLNNRHVPKFVKQYANLYENAQQAIKAYVTEVQKGQFPQKKHSY